ncbi:MAG: glutamate--tRNA ligase [Pseudomonadota bacterium]
MTDLIVTRFAPSPTGYLHIGGARTALFNWLFARRHNGKFLLRIEDTDAKRSTKEAIDAIFAGLTWLGLEWDGDALFQSQRVKRHQEIAAQLLETGHAYRCYASKEELKTLRDEQRAAGKPIGYDGRWRDKDPSEAPSGVDPVIRFKAPQNGVTTLEDLVQGAVSVQNEALDDMVILRADGTPTYMLSVVVDDHDMGVTHALRGDDHLTNAFRQTQLFYALDWQPPTYGHVPLIHGPDGAKLSKRHGALGVEAYRDMGYLPEAMRNYLLRLGWAHGDEEIIETSRAIELFDTAGIGRSPARLDLAKLASVNAAYLKERPSDELAQLSKPYIEAELAAPLSEDQFAVWSSAIETLKERSKTLIEIANNGKFYVAKRPIDVDEKAGNILKKTDLNILQALFDILSELGSWTTTSLEQAIKGTAEQLDLGFGKVAQPLRAATCGTMASPALFDVLYILGKDETLARLADQL